MAYATVDDLAARWRPLTADEEVRATELLEDAAVRVDAAKAPANPITDSGVRKIISCDMVKRAMISGVGITQQSQNSNGFSQAVTYANPTGDMYLTKEDKRLLGLRRQTASTVWMGQA